MTYGDEVRDSAVAMMGKGVSDAAIAASVNVGKTTVRRWRRALGIAPIEWEADGPAHGSTRRYHNGCRCEKCVNARKVERRRTMIRRALKEVESI